MKIINYTKFLTCFFIILLVIENSYSISGKHKNIDQNSENEEDRRNEKNKKLNSKLEKKEENITKKTEKEKTNKEKDIRKEGKENNKEEKGVKKEKKETNIDDKNAKRLEKDSKKTDKDIKKEVNTKNSKKEELKKKELIDELKEEKRKIDQQIKNIENELETKNNPKNEKKSNSKIQKSIEEINSEENSTNHKNNSKKSQKTLPNNGMNQANSSKLQKTLTNKIKIMENNINEINKKQKKLDSIISKNIESSNFGQSNHLNSQSELLDTITINSRSNPNLLNSFDNSYLRVPNSYSMSMNTIGKSQNYIYSNPINPSQNNNFNIINNDVPTFRVIENGNDPQHSKILKTETVEYKLPSINIDNSRGIDYYYPFFFKTKVIDYRQNFQIDSLASKCLELTCDLCEIDQIEICRKCRHGFFLHMGKCFNRCPINTVADIYKGTCNQLDHSASLSQVSYLKAFTFGSCKNICGKESIDCSCESICVYQGNCCSDYHECEDIILLNQNKVYECQTGNPSCELCENFIHKEDPMIPGKILPFKCGKCREGFMLRYGECVPACNPNDKIILPNKICISNQKCLVENCMQCVDNNPSVCKNCIGGFFMHNNLCLPDCPKELRADRISMTCVQAPTFAWYWVYPSKSTCREKCNLGINGAVGMDCACDRDCLRRGNCCQDFDDFCPDLIVNIK